MAVPAVLWMAPAAMGGGGTARSATTGVVAAVAAAAADPMSLWSKRSPGERGLALLSSKPRRAPPEALAPPPTQRVLPTIRDRPKPVPLRDGEPSELFGPPGIPAEPGPPPVDFLPGLPVGPTPVGGYPYYPFYPPYFGGGGGGGGGGPFPVPPPVVPPVGPPDEPVTPDVPVTPPDIPVTPGPETPVTPVNPDFPVTPPVIPGGPIDWPGNPPTPPTPPLPPSPVPEPATWLMMILGFFSLGVAVRRARTRRAEP